MKTAILFPLLLCTCAFSFAANDMPSSWGEFKSSKKDAAMVKQIEAAKWDNLCIEYGRGVRAKSNTRRFNAVRDYLVDGNFLIGRDLGRAKEREFGIGMTQCGILASLGRPDDINNTTTRAGTRSQWVFREQRIYIYIDEQKDGFRVTSFQN